MKQEIEITGYNPNNGLQLNWEKDFSIKVIQNENEVILTANKAGLYSLANHLLNLAQDGAPAGSHIHLDENNSLEEGSSDLIIEKVGM